MISVRTLRIVRWAQIGALLAVIGDLAYVLDSGHPIIALIPAPLIILWLALICATTVVIRKREELDRLESRS